MAGVLNEVNLQRFTGEDGGVVGALMFFYLVNTTVLADIYEDVDLTTPLANPVPVAAGELIPDVYLDPSIVYRRRIVYNDGTVDDQNPYGGLAFSLAGSSGASLVGFKQNGTDSAARTVDNELKEQIKVTQFFGTDSFKTQAALTYASTLPNGGEVVMPSGTYNFGSTAVTVPQKVTLKLVDARIVSSAANAIQISLGSDSQSGRLVGIGHSSVIQHSGTGYGIACLGAGESRANVFIENLRVTGTVSGSAGLYSTVMNRMTVKNCKFSGYTSGHGALNNGSNAVNFFSCSFEGNLHGLTNNSIFTTETYSANAIMAFGCHFVGNTGWGWQEINSGGSTPNGANLISGCTFENNGTNGSPTSGHIYAAYSDGLSVSSNYFEDYSGTAPTNAVLIGSSSNASTSVSVVNNSFFTSGTNVVNVFRGQATVVTDNYGAGSVTNFVLHGSASRGSVLLRNIAPAAANVVGGADDGVDLVTDSGAWVNAQGATIRGFGFNAISGFAQDLAIRTRGGGSNCVNFLAADGTNIGSMNNSGAFNTATSYSVGGTKVLGPRVTGVPVDLAAIHAALVSHGLIST